MSITCTVYVVLQGWRLEVKAYPRLTEFGSRRGKEEAHMHAGFYTQAQVRGMPSLPA